MAKKWICLENDCEEDKGCKVEADFEPAICLADGLPADWKEQNGPDNSQD
jgi:hypothetical protein